MAQIKIKRTSGSTGPTGLTFGEQAYVQGLKSLYIGQTGGDPALRIGAEVTTDSSFTSATDNKIPSQLAVKTYVDNNVAGGAVSSLNGLTGAVFIGAGTAIGLAVAAKGITVTNTGVQSFNGSTGAVTGVSSAVAGTGIAVSGSTGAVTFTNTGVQSLAGTANQITVSGSTGAVTLSLPSTVTVPGALNVTTNLTVTGNLTVNGTTTTVNSDSLTIDDPIITLGLSGGVPIAVSDGGRSRGIAMSYFDGTAGQTAFIGFSDQSSPLFAVYTKANISGEAIEAGSTFGILQANAIYLQRDANTSSIGRHVIQSQSTSVGAGGRAAIFADHGGYVAMPQTLGTADFILKATGATAQPTWINSNSTGFTAFTSTNVITTSDTSDTSAVIAFVPAATDGNQAIKYNSGLTYNAVSNSLSATTFVGALSGNATSATTATNATNVATTSDTSDTVAYIAFVPLASDTNQAVKYNSGLTYNAVSNSLSATTFVGALSGNATTSSTLQTARTIGITGDINGTATSFNGSADITITATIAANSVLLGTDTTGNYLAQLTTTSTGLTVGGGIGEQISQTVNLTTITSGLNMEIFTFASGEFTNATGTISLGVVDGGSY
jgi:hypothetical protein